MIFSYIWNLDSILMVSNLQAGSLYNEGMQPVMYSVLGARDTGIGWRRAGHSIKYFKTNLRRFVKLCVCVCVYNPSH